MEQAAAGGRRSSWVRWAITAPFAPAQHELGDAAVVKEQQPSATRGVVALQFDLPLWPLVDATMELREAASIGGSTKMDVEAYHAARAVGSANGTEPVTLPHRAEGFGRTAYPYVRPARRYKLPSRCGAFTTTFKPAVCPWANAKPP